MPLTFATGPKPNNPSPDKLGCDTLPIVTLDKPAQILYNLSMSVTNQVAAPKVHPRQKPRINLSEALSLYFQRHWSSTDIANRYGVSRQAVEKAIKKVIALDPEGNQAYKQNRSEVLTAVELKLLNEMVAPNKLKKATSGNCAYAFDKIALHRRLQDGEATAIISYEDASAEYERAIAERDKLLQSGADDAIMVDSEGSSGSDVIDIPPPDNEA